MTLLQKFQDRRNNPPSDIAERILFELMNDLTDRRGFHQEWDAVDDEIKEDILQVHLGIIQKNLK